LHSAHTIHQGFVMIKKYLDFAGHFIEENKISGIIIALISFLFVFGVSFSDAYERFDLNLYDLSFSIKPSINEWDKLSFIDIDDNSTDTLGQFPWPRRLYGEGLRVMKEAGVSFAALDMMFPNSSPLEVLSDHYDRIESQAVEGKKLDAEEVKNAIMNNDRIFADGIREMGKVILSFNLGPEPVVEDVRKAQSTERFQKALKIFLEKSSVAASAKDIEKYRPLEDLKTQSISYPIPELIEAAHGFGFVNRDTDIDGAVRKVRLVQLFKGRLYFNLAMVMLLNTCGVDIKNVVVEPGKYILLRNAFNPVTFETGDMRIPINKQGMIYVNWAGPGPREKSFRILPYYALMEYNTFVDGVYNFFDEQGGPETGLELSRNNGEIEKNIALYNKEKDAVKRKALYVKTEELRKANLKIKNTLADPIRDEIKRIQEALKEKPKNDKQLKSDLAHWQNELQAIELVLRVEKLRDNVTITGLTATGTIDIGQTPTWNEYAMVGAYHNTINTILQRKFIRKSPAWVNYIIMLIFALLMGFTIQRQSARTSVITIVLSMVVINAALVLIFVYINVWSDQLGINLALVLPSAAITSMKFMREENQKKFIKNAFARYLAPGVIDQIIEHPESLQLGGEEREITIFFSDVAKFSTLSEKLTPPELVSLLNEYLSEMTDIILKWGGTIDKYEGDAVMAFFGAPHPFEDHALRACMASIEQKKRLREMQEQWRSEGRDELKVRMGMNTGRAVVGNMGSRTRMDYTAMGDSVNLASRLEGANKFYLTNAMVSQATYEAAKDSIEGRKLDIIRVVGKTEPILIYELLGKKGDLPPYMYDMLKHYYDGLELFGDRQWKRARMSFKEALRIVKDDGPSLTYVKRCEEYMKKPPSKTWDGVYSFKSK